MEANKANIAETIKKLRNKMGITQKQLAKETGISLSSIIDYENARREPNSKAMAALEKYFNVSGAFLRGETGIPSQKSIVKEAAKPVITKELIQSSVSKALENSENCGQTFLMHGGGGDKVSEEDSALFFAADEAIVREMMQKKICARIMTLDTTDLERVQQIMDLAKIPDEK